MTNLIQRARDVAGRLNENAEDYTGDLQCEASAIIAELVELLEGRGECICGKCGIRHGGSIVHADF